MNYAIKYTNKIIRYIVHPYCRYSKFGLLLTLAVLKIPAKLCFSWSKQVNSILPEVLIIVSRGEWLGQCCKVVGETLPIKWCRN